MSTISVVMSVYGLERPDYLKLALKSIWHDQTHKPDEIILIEDGPLSAELNEVVMHFGKELPIPFIILKNADNIGLTKSLNRGIEIAACDYVARMDSDDISLPERFQRQLEFMDSHPEVDILGTGIQEIDENGKWGMDRIYPETHERIRNYIHKANPVAHPTAFIRKRVFDEGNLYNEKFPKNQDLDLWFRLLKQGYTFHNLPDELLLFRRTEETYVKRASTVSIRSELSIYMHGINQLYGGVSWRYIYPLSRFCVKIMPTGITRYVYNHFFSKKNK